MESIFGYRCDQDGTGRGRKDHGLCMPGDILNVKSHSFLGW